MRSQTSALIGLATLFVLVGCQPREEHAVTPKRVHTELSFVDETVGEGPEAAEGDRVYIEYTGRLADGGAQFDSNVDNPNNRNPFTFVIGEGGAIEGMEEGLRGMRVGGRRSIKIPHEKGYGAEGSPPNIPPFADLEFDVKLLGVVKRGEETFFDVEDLKVGAGREVKDGDEVEVHYVGRMLNGRVVDDSRKRGKTVVFRVGASEAITSVERGVVGMRVGGRRKLTIPPEAGWSDYGTEGIPPNQVIVYEIDLLAVR